MRSALVEDTVKSRTGVTNRPRHPPLRSNSSRTLLHHEEQLHEPTHRRRQASPNRHQQRKSATHTTGAQPPPTPDLHPPSMCARHSPAGRRPNPATHIWRPTNDTQVAPTARRRRVKGPPQALHEVRRSRHGRPQKFLAEKFRKAVTSEKQPHTEEVEAEEAMVRREDTRTLAHDGQTCSQPCTLFIGQKRARSSSRPVGRFGEFCSESKSGKSPESA